MSRRKCNCPGVACVAEFRSMGNASEGPLPARWAVAGVGAAVAADAVRVAAARRKSPATRPGRRYAGGSAG